MIGAIAFSSPKNKGKRLIFHNSISGGKFHNFQGLRVAMNAKSWVIKNCVFAKHKPANTVSIAAFREVAGQWEVLVGLRSSPPAEHEWALPGGHVDPAESLKEAAAREFKEETGLIAGDLTFVQRELRKGQNRDRIDSVFCTVVSTKNNGKAESDLEDIKWVPVNNLPDLAFKHDKAIRKSIEFLPSK